MKNPFLLTTCALMCAGLVFTSTGCKKITNSGGTITIKGRLLQDCSGMPVKLMPLEFYLKSYSTAIGGESGTIGIVTTDLEGNFSVTGHNYGTGSLSVSNESKGHRFVYNYGIDGGDGATVDLGTVYDQVSYYSAANIHIQSTREPSDTLYIGPAYDVQMIYPVVAGTDIKKVFSGSSPGESLNYNYQIGILYAFSRKAYDSLQNSSAQNKHIILKTNLCRVIDTTEVTIPQ